MKRNTPAKTSTADTSRPWNTSQPMALRASKVSVPTFATKAR